MLGLYSKPVVKGTTKSLIKGAELPDAEEKKLDNAFIKGDNYCFTIGEMTLHLDKVQSFDS